MQHLRVVCLSVSLSLSLSLSVCCLFCFTDVADKSEQPLHQISFCSSLDVYLFVMIVILVIIIIVCFITVDCNNALTFF